jgi:predicted enzyme related to lactoylglutathione lyase
MRDRPFSITGLDLSGYMVRDAKRAIAFYRDVLGMQPTTLYPDDRGAEFEFADGTTFGLWSADPESMPFTTSNGVLFAVDDFDGAVAAMKARDIPIVMQFETPGCFMAMVNDTEGNLLTLHKRKAS